MGLGEGLDKEKNKSEASMALKAEKNDILMTARKISKSQFIYALILVWG